jgi:molybdate transport system regulatory protein
MAGEETGAGRTAAVRTGVSLRVDLPNGFRLGPGKVALLEAVERTGSISAAGRATGMSYRRAWLLLDDLNRAFQTPVTTAAAGGVRGGGATVTDFGRALVAAYRALEADTAALAARHMAAAVSVLSDDPDIHGTDRVEDGPSE